MLTERNVQDHVDYVVLAPLSSFSMGSSGLFGAAVSKISLTAAYGIGAGLPLRAGLPERWTSGASSWVDLTPPGASNTMVAGDYVNANDNLPQGQQVGYAYINRNVPTSHLVRYRGIRGRRLATGYH